MQLIHAFNVSCDKKFIIYDRTDDDYLTIEEIFAYYPHLLFKEIKDINLNCDTPYVII